MRLWMETFVDYMLTKTHADALPAILASQEASEPIAENC